MSSTAMNRGAVRTDRGNAIATGLLYIAATVAGVASIAVGAPTEWSAMAASENQVLVTILLTLVMAITVAGVAFMIYPVLRQDADTSMKHGLAVWYLGSRITEGAVFLVAILGTFGLLALSKEAAVMTSMSLEVYAPTALALETMSEYGWVLGQTAFCIGAAMLYYLLYVSKRVPRWLSVWGLIAAPLMLIAGFTLPFTNDPNSTVSTVLYMPMAIQEMVFAVWLIARGFNPSTAGSAS